MTIQQNSTSQRSLKSNIRSTRNRIHSILYDSEWIKEVQESYNLPLIPNERCGLWYVAPHLRKDTAYFKSTDGHTNEWSFSTRRLNFHLLDLMLENNGLIIVDSTRRGKTMPDALSKTIPIWCAVLNYIMFGSNETNNWCFVPPSIISKNEHNSIIKLIPIFAKQVEELGLITKNKLIEKFQGKYIRPLWIYPGLSLPFEPPIFEDFIPVINCVASFRADDGKTTLRKKLNDETSGITIAEYQYVQGAADDHELWSFNLTPDLLWQHKEELELNLQIKNDDELIEYIQGLKLESSYESSSTDVVSLTNDLSIGKVVDDIDPNTLLQFDVIILLSKQFNFKNLKDDSKQKTYRYELSSDKKGSNELRKHVETISSQFNGNSLVLCETGTDLSPAVALLQLTTKFNTMWEPVLERPIVTKNTIKKHLAKILEKKKVNPSRATLQSINTYLM
ncbi:tRNA A64-2'-O-ribosylphosphate transferase [Wickerhamomyces ciferrii]|uniref:tRNA A64-2'-O-ribosylphosphate transferase n=1 Tax=Wickerhamomyces ciferrii (strain ATCC 14091 / BCRC 22168 / CBS 111 / JCM 3599 / NBRC 0793 / NRRL Y-1031 F-60-10) TaxID=1206466 RepID=K0KV37_WICCF|nr:tRNA A64-2'-O-ribosylphosphate transferase [Wickerhamomyces ciferrii]CCH45274.1 tRNA A64-2'-O-ribosylphosphate transferase [Wickerhamomyces ciferrii]